MVYPFSEMYIFSFELCSPENSSLSPLRFDKFTLEENNL